MEIKEIMISLKLHLQLRLLIQRRPDMTTGVILRLLTFQLQGASFSGFQDQRDSAPCS
jgi:hypothetical protein